MRLMPWMKLDSRIAGGPVIWRSGKRVQQLVEHHGDLAAGQVGAEAEVRAAGAEAHVVVEVRTGDVEAIRVGEDRLVAVGRVVPEHDLLALGDLRRRRSRCPAVAVRRKWITGVAQRTISSTAVRERGRRSRSSQSARWSGWSVSSLHAVADGVAGGLVAGGDEQDEERSELLRRQALAVDLGVHQRRGEVVLRVGEAVLAEADRHLVERHRGRHQLARCRHVLGVADAEDGVRRREHRVPLARAGCPSSRR